MNMQNFLIRFVISCIGVFSITLKYLQLERRVSLLYKARNKTVITFIFHNITNVNKKKPLFSFLYTIKKVSFAYLFLKNGSR